MDLGSRFNIDESMVTNGVSEKWHTGYLEVTPVGVFRISAFVIGSVGIAQRAMVGLGLT